MPAVISDAAFFTVKLRYVEDISYLISLAYVSNCLVN